MLISLRMLEFFGGVKTQTYSSTLLNSFFTPLLCREEIRMSDLVGNGSMVFLQSEDDDNSAVALSVLAQAMVELDVVAIVR